MLNDNTSTTGGIALYEMSMKTGHFVCIIYNYNIGKHRYLAICITCLHSWRIIKYIIMISDTRPVVRLRIPNEKIIIIDVFRQQPSEIAKTE